MKKFLLTFFPLTVVFTSVLSTVSFIAENKRKNVIENLDEKIKHFNQDENIKLYEYYSNQNNQINDGNIYSITNFASGSVIIQYNNASDYVKINNKKQLVSFINDISIIWFVILKNDNFKDHLLCIKLNELTNKKVKVYINNKYELKNILSSESEINLTINKILISNINQINVESLIDYDYKNYEINLLNDNINVGKFFNKNDLFILKENRNVHYMNSK